MACLNGSIRGSGSFSQFLFNNCFRYTDTYKYDMGTTKPSQHYESPPAILSQVPRTEPPMAFDTYAKFDTKALSLQRLFFIFISVFTVKLFRHPVLNVRETVSLRNRFLTCPFSWGLSRAPEHHIFLAPAS